MLKARDWENGIKKRNDDIRKFKFLECQNSNYPLSLRKYCRRCFIFLYIKTGLLP